jgi:lysophospholipid acyltransferase (LPLAT)-like uncharacterized protein
LKKFLKKGSHLVLSTLLAYSAKTALNLLMWTCRLHVNGLDNLTKIASQSQGCILMVWHKRLLLVASILSQCTPELRYAAFISKNRDAETLAILANSYKNGRALRVPHDGRHAALKSMIEVLRKGDEIVIITPDGPKGPIYKVKPGIVTAAKASSASIVPFSWQADRYWEFNTWDKLVIPKPFSTISVSFGDPILLERQEELTSCQTRLEEAMKTLTL